MSGSTESAKELFERLYTCRDPECTAHHVDMTNLPDGLFVEESL